MTSLRLPVTPVERLLIAVAFTLSAVAIARWQTSTPHVEAPARHVVPPTTTLAFISEDSLDAAADLTVTNDPFRLSNRPAEVSYDPQSDGLTVPVAPLASPRPLLVLKGIVGGPPWQAIIDGLPGQPAATVAQQGSVFDKLVVRSVSRDSVVIQGPDTSWTLGFRKRS
jgi:hypothetical protein